MLKGDVLIFVVFRHLIVNGPSVLTNLVGAIFSIRYETCPFVGSRRLDH